LRKDSDSFIMRKTERTLRKSYRNRWFSATMAAIPAAVFPTMASAQLVFNDDFNTAGSAANYNVYVTPGATGPSSDATFGYNYGALPSVGGLAIPLAPHTTDGSTLGLRLRVDNLQTSVGTVLGAITVATKTLSLPSRFVLSADVWGNYIGGTSIAASGSNGSTGAGVGVGTSGSGLTYPVSNDGLLVDTFHDNGGGANQQYRLYLDNAHPNPTTSAYWSAGTGANSASYTDPYYSFLTSHTAPAGQTTFAPATQGGSTPAGIIGFAWHTMTITQDGLNLTWAIDNVTITTVPDSALTFGGSQISLNAIDSGLTGNSAANNQLLNADIWDNLTITQIPEPASISLLGLGAVGLWLARRRK
jgi:hypothetical protein